MTGLAVPGTAMNLHGPSVDSAGCTYRGRLAGADRHSTRFD
ncbi:hypothetical protein ACIRQQ_40625 [Streptomyces fuscichromogenes]